MSSRRPDKPGRVPVHKFLAFGIGEHVSDQGMDMAHRLSRQCRR
jgi:hypothetical protein